MTQRIPEFLVCPCCKGRLYADKAPDAKTPESLLCPACGLAFRVSDGVPMMVPHDAARLSDEEVGRLREKIRQTEGREGTR